MDQKLTPSNLLSRMSLICEEFFNSITKTLLLLFVPKVHEVGVFGSLVLARVLERILSCKIIVLALQTLRSRTVRFRDSGPFSVKICTAATHTPLRRTRSPVSVRTVT